MSGGSMEYLCFKVESAEFERNTPLRTRFAEHLKLVGKALHDIEWVDSGDYGPGDEDDAIEACLADAHNPQTLLHDISAAIGKRKLEEARARLGDLIVLAGADDPEVTRISTLLAFLEGDD